MLVSVKAATAVRLLLSDESGFVPGTD